jgi:hypothetical protein
MDRKLSMISLSNLEQGRIREPVADPMDLSGFPSIEGMIRHSLSPPKLLQTLSPAGSRLMNPKTVERPFQDENLLKKLIQFKHQIPLSPRIIRATDS